MPQIAKSLEMTLTETFRHLQRLSEAKLVEKKTDGTYGITSLGTLATGLLSSFNFVLKHGDYFLEHDVSSLPYEFVNRLGELSTGDFCEETMSNFNRVRKMVLEAEEYIWTIAEQVETSLTSITNEKVPKGFKVKFIMQQDLAKTYTVTQETELLKERRYLKRIDLSLLITEKESVLNLRRHNGQMDYFGFFGKD